ncbi:MAG: pitrilysin family protein [Bacteroidota bacterium]
MSKTTLDRSIAPPIHPVKDLKLPEIFRYRLDNGIQVHELNMGTQEIVKMEIVFLAGRPYEQKKLASRTTIGLLKEGTSSMSSAQIAETIDFYGASLGTPFNLDTSNVVLHTLSKHFERLLPIIQEIIATPSFPERELQSFIQRSQQRLKVDLSKEDVVAYRTITEYIFDKTTPYGYNSYPEDYEAVSRADVVNHFEQNYRSNQCMIFISGYLPKSTRQLMNRYIGQLKMDAAQTSAQQVIIENIPQSVKIQHPEGLQTAIRIGRRLFTRNHPDYPAFFVLNTILGGYFGSRLMANIREENGYTYNIYSALDAMKYDGYFYIGTEVGNEFVAPTRTEIYKEIKRLQEELVGAEELTMVKNYLMGTLLMSLDGAFNIMDVHKSLVTNDLNPAYFDVLTNTIQQITAENLQIQAQKYLQKDSLWEVIVGNL